MSTDFHGVKWDLDRRSRESMPAPRARATRDWIALADQMGAETTTGLSDHAPQHIWLPALPLCLTAFRAGRLPLLRLANTCRRHLFQHPVRFARFFAIGYLTPPASLQQELTWLRSIGVSQVVLPLDQNASDLQQGRTLAAIHNLHAENCRVAAIISPRFGAPPESWYPFCQGLLSQTGWQLEFLQLGTNLHTLAKEHAAPQALRLLYEGVPRLHRDYPGVALLAPAVNRCEDLPALQTLRHLLPEGATWDGLTLQAAPWQELESVGWENLFLRQLTLANAINPHAPQARLHLIFPPQPPGCEPAATERIAGMVVRRVILAVSSGMANRATFLLDPAMEPAERQACAIAIRTMMSLLEGATFVRRLQTQDDQHTFVLLFERSGHPPLLAGWTDGDPQQVAVPFPIGQAHDFLGRHVPLLPNARVRLTRNLAYYIREK
jgi:hypothetical protein